MALQIIARDLVISRNTRSDNSRDSNLIQEFRSAKNCASPDMVQKRKDSKRPELQLYRPGMGLQKNRNKTDDNTDNSSVCEHSTETKSSVDQTKGTRLSLENSQNVKNCVKRSVENGGIKKPKPNSSGDKSSKGGESKKGKNRKPDLPVYTPKPRHVAMFKGAEAVDSVSAEGETDHTQGCVESQVTSSGIISNEKNVTNSDKRKPSRKAGSKQHTPVNKLKTHEHNECRPSSTDSSRSTPDGFSEDSIPVHNEVTKISDSKTTSSKKPEQSKSTKDTYKSITITNSNHKVQRCWADMEYTPSSYDSTMKQSTGYEIESPKVEAKLSNNPCEKSSKFKESSNHRHSKGVYHNDDVKVSTKEESHRYRSKTDHHQSNGCDFKRNKKERHEQTVPPRFQKRASTPIKIDNPDGRGIIRLPVEMLPVDVPGPPDGCGRYPLSMPPQYSPPQFVHKQLFNPKNPNVPEIVNIPAVPDFQAANHGGDYPQNGTFINPPVYSSSSRNVSNGYIPPPRPRSVDGPYQFHNAGFPVPNGVPEHVMPYVVPNVRPCIPYMAPCQVPGQFTLPPPVPPPLISNEYVTPPVEKKKYKPIVDKNLRDIYMLESELTSLISKDQVKCDLDSMKQCRWKLQLRYENIILADPRYCAEKNAEQQLWKSSYYQIIEILRKNMDKQPDNRDLKEDLLSLVNEGTVFYENLLEKQQETFGFNLSQLLEKDDLSRALPESLRLVLISTQKILIYLGDLARYKEIASGTTNFGKARSLYLKAQQLAPKNGRPYHQLAVLALCARRKLDAVYYFMRSLAASNPFLSAQEYLLNLFEEAKKKYEAYEKKRQDEIANEIEIICADYGERCEVWIKPDGSKVQQDSLFDLSRGDLEFKKLSTVELNKRFITSFLHVHGKLFTKVGMESFDEVVSQMLKEFQYLLQRRPFPLESSRLLQLLAINMYAVANSSFKDGTANGHPNLLQVKALGVSQAMICLIMKQCSALHKIHMASSDYPRQVISDHMAHLFPTVKIWTDWMSCQRELWPLCVSSCGRTSKYGCDIDVWSSFAELLTILRDTNTTSLGLQYEGKEGFDHLTLDEDSTLSGFVPLLGAVQGPAFVKPTKDKENVKNILRVVRIQFFGDYLCGIPTPYLEFNVELKEFNSVVSFSSDKENKKSSSDLWESNDDLGDDSIDSEDAVLNSSLDEEGGNEINLLWSKREALSREKARLEKYNARVQAVLRKVQNQRPIVLQIQPRYLVPDTNCFIDFLQDLKDVLALQVFHLIVPLVVINELDGLARGTKESTVSTPEHVSKVAERARAAILFLEQEFAARNSFLRAITSKGTVIDTISFRAEDVGRPKGDTNDDLILSCCLFYCTDRPQQYMPKLRDEPIQLQREIVLLTDDRNLRVKALTHNVPARDLQSFFRWAKS